MDRSSSHPQQQEHSLRKDLRPDQQQAAAAAHVQADRDMEEDADLTAHSPNDDLDEGETARLGEGPNPLI